MKIGTVKSHPIKSLYEKMSVVLVLLFFGSSKSSFINGHINKLNRDVSNETICNKEKNTDENFLKVETNDSPVDSKQFMLPVSIDVKYGKDIKIQNKGFDDIYIKEETKDIKLMTSLSATRASTTISYKYDTEINLYAVNTSVGVFISSESFKDCQIKMINFEMKSGLITDTEYSQLITEIYSDSVSVISDVQMLYSNIEPDQQYSYFDGSLSFKSDQEQIYPLKDTYVELRGKSDTDLSYYIESTYTDEQGNYSIEECTDPYYGYSDVQGLYIRVYPKTSHLQVYQDESLSLKYYYDLPLITNIYHGYHRYINNAIFDMHDTNNNASFIGRAFQISQALYYGERYVFEMSGEHPLSVNAVYNSDIRGCSYSSNRINCRTSAYNEWDPLLHEYGHHIQHKYGITNSPGGNHSGNDNDITHNSNNFSKSNGIRLAWGESWPTVFGNLVTKYYADDIGNIRWNNDDQYNSYGSNNGDELEVTYTYAIGEGCEMNIIQVLYDMYDDYSSFEPFDRIALGHQGLWDLITNSNATTFSDFIQHCYRNTSIESSDLGAILEISGMAATDISVEYDEETLIPTISWRGQNCTLRRNGTYGTDYEYRSNQFAVRYKDENGSVFGMLYIVGANSYTIGDYPLEIVRERNMDHFYIQVVSYQTFEFTTGPYLSEMVRIEYLGY